MWTHWKVYLGALGVGMLGMLTIVVALHLWADHAQHHAVWDLEVQRAQAQRAAQAPSALPQAAPPPTAPK